MEERESLLQSVLALLTMLEVSHCMSTELSVLGVEERESLLQSELALFTILEVSHYMSNARSVLGWRRGSHSSILEGESLYYYFAECPWEWMRGSHSSNLSLLSSTC
jgi:hypothetical protein